MSKCLGEVQIKLIPSDRQKGQIAMSRFVTTEQWEAIKKILEQRN